MDERVASIAKPVLMSFNYYEYKCIKIVRIVRQKISYKNARINAKVLF